MELQNENKVMKSDDFLKLEIKIFIDMVNFIQLELKSFRLCFMIQFRFLFDVKLTNGWFYRFHS